MQLENNKHKGPHAVCTSGSYMNTLTVIHPLHDSRRKRLFKSPRAAEEATARSSHLLFHAIYLVGIVCLHGMWEMRNPTDRLVQGERVEKSVIYPLGIQMQSYSFLDKSRYPTEDGVTNGRIFGHARGWDLIKRSPRDGSGCKNIIFRGRPLKRRRPSNLLLRRDCSGFSGISGVA
jgi:hypothetical protein